MASAGRRKPVRAKVRGHARPGELRQGEAPRKLTCGPVAWYGGKGRMTAKLLPLIPYTRVYCELFGGGASLLCARRPSPIEVYNDLDGRLVNLFRVLQRPRLARRLEARLRRTAYSRAEFLHAIRRARESSDAVDAAWGFFVQQNQGFAGISEGLTRGNWGRSLCAKVTRVSGWWSRVARLNEWCSRVAQVQIDEADAVTALRFWDTDETTFYVDPPYVADTRVDRRVYRHEYTDEQHRALVSAMLAARGAIVLSGYESALYEPLVAAGWERRSFDVTCSAAGRVRGSELRGSGAAYRKARRVEVVWRNPRAVAIAEPAAREMVTAAHQTAR